MPTIASQSTSAAVRRARRRERRVQSRGHSPVVFQYNSSPAVRKRVPRRPNRDQSSFHLDNCFNICQTTGFHQDPDVHIGSRAAEVNQFAVLDPETSAPSLPTPPQSKFTFTCPPSSTTTDAGSATLSREGTVPTQLQQLSPRRLGLKKIWPYRASSEPSEPQYTPPLPSIPTTPPARARVKLPCTFPASPLQTPPLITPTPTKGYFDGIRIPSPLLYHRRSREQLLSHSSDADIALELTNQFLLTCGREIPEPDFESYKPINNAPIRRESLSPTVLPDANEYLQRQRDLSFRNVPHPPWIVRPYQPASRKDLPILTTTNIFSISQLGIPCDEALTSQCFSSLKQTEAACDLIFPKLPAPPSADTIVPQQRSRTRVVSDFIDDDPAELRKRWKAFEDAVSNPKRQHSSSDDTVITHPTKTPHLFGLPQSETKPWFDFTACPTSDCMALVPARLCQHQYTGWPPSLVKVANVNDIIPAMEQSTATEKADNDKTATLAAWMADLGLDAQHSKGCPVPIESVSSSGFDLGPLFEIGSQRQQPRDTDSTFGVTEPSPPSDTNSEVLVSQHSNPLSDHAESLDEGYFTGESMIDLEQGDAAMTEEEWTEWDWDDAPESQHDADKIQGETTGTSAQTEGQATWAIGMW